MNENLPFISIIITCFNSKKTILETIDSIVNQTYQYWECIIVDDKSTDNSQEIIRDYIKDDERFLFIEMQSNNGKSFNLNYALSITRAEIIINS
ncbi:glycosyltransferase family 2 protein [Sphingobacterium sp. T2]|uniref:glycosyltransferase family 2 protein n=1 Tax=Sphingobacterium sp. T2 TaxID=1590596 RepID=UPI00068C692D|nr:glycosyltransferase family 2 protein [Sphingobacterium sp. T2]